MINSQKAIQVLRQREDSLKNDNPNLQEKRRNFLDWLLGWDFSESKTIILKNSSVTKQGDRYEHINFNYQGGFQTLEMYNLGNDVLKTKPIRYLSFIPEHNTRTKINSETCLECDKLPFDKVSALMCETIMSLIRNNIHFAVFYAEGQRSPHIRIYDFFQLEELNPQQRIKAQIEFWRQHVPFGCFNYFDTGVFVDSHPLQLEFAPHWKYHTPFNLLFEWIHNQGKVKCSQLCPDT